MPSQTIHKFDGGAVEQKPVRNDNSTQAFQMVALPLRLPAGIVLETHGHLFTVVRHITEEEAWAVCPVFVQSVLSNSRLRQYDEMGQLCWYEIETYPEDLYE